MNFITIFISWFFSGALCKIKVLGWLSVKAGGDCCHYFYDLKLCIQLVQGTHELSGYHRQQALGAGEVKTEESPWLQRGWLWGWRHKQVHCHRDHKLGTFLNPRGEANLGTWLWDTVPAEASRQDTEWWSLPSWRNRCQDPEGKNRAAGEQWFRRKCRRHSWWARKARARSWKTPNRKQESLDRDIKQTCTLRHTMRWVSGHRRG